MSTDSARTLVLPVTVLVSVAVGVFIGNSLSKRAEPQTSARADALPTDELAAAMRALTAELERARRDSGGLTNAPTRTERAEAAPVQDVAGASELREATRQLVAALDLLRSTTLRTNSDGALIEPAVTPDPTRLDAFTPGGPPDQMAPYMMWTYQQVLDRFGKPVSVFKGERGFQWFYISPAGMTVRFGFEEGRLSVIQSSKP